MTATVNFDAWLPEGESLFDYQHVGVGLALLNTAGGKGTFIADEQGLGKTRQAITAALVRGCQHILVICKASLKANWAREIARCAPAWDVQILTGQLPYEAISPVNIIQFDLLTHWADALVAEKYDCLIIDESHYLKSLGTAKNPVLRTVAAMKVADDVRRRQGLMLLLTGTPLLNRPVELVTQLQMMGRLEEISPRPRRGTTLRDYEYAFKNSFCAPQYNGHGYEYKGSSHEDLLHLRMRQTCLIRRLRNEVLDMVDTHRVQTPLSLNGGLDNYWATEKNFQAKNANSYYIELLGKLRMAAGLAKIDAAVDWINTFLEENEGKKVVVWAWHQQVQSGIARKVKGAINLRDYQSGSPEMQAAVDKFNTDPECRVVVCSLRAHAEGLTMVGDGHNVTDSLFVELPWHPGSVAQAEDRINRIGQLEACFATTLIVPGTVDEWLANLIAEKWETFKAILNGTIPAVDIDIQGELLAKLQAHMQSKYGK